MRTSRALPDVPPSLTLDATRIAGPSDRFQGTLYQGHAPPTGDAARHAGFDAIVLCAEEYQPTDFPGVRVLHVPLDDARPTPEEWLRANVAARDVASLLRAGKRVLVTCWQGRNRSGLVVALALRRMGMTGQQAVERVRSRRAGALTNPHFVEAILRTRGRAGRAPSLSP